MTARMLTAHDVAADGSWEDQPGLGFRLGKRGRRFWSCAAYGAGYRVRISSLMNDDRGGVVRYVPQDTPITMVFYDGRLSDWRPEP
jgi:hypothetical protein